MHVRPTSTRCLLLLSLALAVPSRLTATTYVADPAAAPDGPEHYLRLLAGLAPGDTLQLPAGRYPERLNLNGLQGIPGAWITIEGPAQGPPAIVTTESACCNTVQLGDTWYVALRDLTIDSNSAGGFEGLDGINAKDGVTHDILIEGCTILGQSDHQQTVGISTKSIAWNWIIRGNRILEAGTGIYLGDSSGGAPFVAGLVESNLIQDTIGYNMQIKHQNAYTPPAGMPGEPHRTVIRNNVFIKSRPQSDWPASRVDGARPSLLVDGFPDNGYGSGDLYEIYGNFFYRNPEESLLQASGRVTIHDNVFVGASDTALSLQDHNRPLRVAHVYNNTVYGGARGIRIFNAAREDQAVVGNAVFAADPIGGALTGGQQRDNVVGSEAEAATRVVQPSFVLGEMDFYPLPGALRGSALDLSAFASDADYDLDFNGDAKSGFEFRGAYAGEGSNPGWPLDAGIKTGGPSAPGGGADEPPPAPGNLRVF